jgi:hypothetical protein
MDGPLPIRCCLYGTEIQDLHKLQRRQLKITSILQNSNIVFGMSFPFEMEIKSCNN